MPSCTCATCAPNPELPNGSPYTFSNFNTRSVAVTLNGAQIAALGASIYPGAVKVGEIDLQTNAGLTALTLSSSLVLPVAGTCGVFAAIADANTVNVQGITRLLLTHVTTQNSLPGVPNPSSRSNAMQMGQNTYYRVNQGQKIALYASSPNDVTALLSAVLTAFWIPLQ